MHRAADIQAVDTPALHTDGRLARVVVHEAGAAFLAEVAGRSAAAAGGARVAAQWRVFGEGEARELGGDAEGGGGLPPALEAVADVDGEGGGEGGEEVHGAALAGGVHCGWVGGFGGGGMWGVRWGRRMEVVCGFSEAGYRYGSPCTISPRRTCWSYRVE